MSPPPQVYLILTKGDNQPESKSAASPFSLEKVVINIVIVFSAVFLREQLAKTKVKVLGKVCSMGSKPFLGLLSSEC